MTPGEALAAAKRMLHDDPRAARPLARHAAQLPGVEPRLVLAAALRRCGEVDEAADVLTPLAGTSWGIDYELGMALVATWRAAARAALNRAVARNPASPLARHARDELAALDGGRIAAVPVEPGLVAAVLALLDTGDARPLAAFGLHISDVAAACLVARVGLAHNRIGPAAALLESALAITPGHLSARAILAEALLRAGRLVEARAAVEAVLTAAPDARLQPLLGAILIELGDVAGAVRAYTTATTADPADATAWHGLGHALRARGNQPGAVAAYRRALAIAPDFAEPWWSLANLKTWRFSGDDRAAMTASLARTTIPAARATLHFALGKADDDAGAADAAFVHYAAANAAARPPYDRTAHTMFVDRCIATLTPAFFTARAGWGDPAPDAIFVVGMPRSGSTLVEQILGSHPAVDGLSELPDLAAVARHLSGGRPYPEVLADLPRDAFAAAGRAYLDRVSPRRAGRLRFVDKFPGNVFHAGLIHLALPNATIVDVRRDPRATGWSLFTHRFAGGQAYAYDLADLGQHLRDYARLADHFATVLPRFTTLSYEELVGDTEAQIRRLLDHCGLSFDPACLTFWESPRVVRTPSSEQVRQPMFRGGLDRWRRYAPWLGPLFEALGPVADGSALAAMPILDGAIL
jgi:tetratricopeptide (TPR) repeat protein